MKSFSKILFISLLALATIAPIIPFQTPHIAYAALAEKPDKSTPEDLAKLLKDDPALVALAVDCDAKTDALNGYQTILCAIAYLNRNGVGTLSIQYQNFDLLSPKFFRSVRTMVLTNGDGKREKINFKLAGDFGGENILIPRNAGMVLYFTEVLNVPGGWWVVRVTLATHIKSKNIETREIFQNKNIKLTPAELKKIIEAEVKHVVNNRVQQDEEEFWTELDEKCDNEDGIFGLNIVAGTICWLDGMIRWFIVLIGNLILAIINIFIGIETLVIEWVLKFTAQLASPTGGARGGAGPGLIYIGWTMTRSVMNIIFLLGIIGIAFATMLRIESYSAKKIFWKFLVAALLVNFSLTIAGVILDIGSVGANYFSSKIVGFGGNGWSRLDSALSEGPQVPIQPNPADATKIERPRTREVSTYISPTAALKDDSMFQVILRVVFVIILRILVLIILALLVFLYLIRYIYLGILLILAPIAWPFWVFPSLGTGENIAKQWWSKFLKWVIFAPVSLFFVWLAIHAGGYIGAGIHSMFSSVPLATGASSLASPVLLVLLAFMPFLAGAILLLANLNFIIGSILQVFIVGGILIGGLKAAEVLGIVGAALVMGAMGKIGDWGKRRLKNMATAPLRAAGVQKGLQAVQKLDATKLLGGLPGKYGKVGGFVGKTIEKTGLGKLLRKGGHAGSKLSSQAQGHNVEAEKKQLPPVDETLKRGKKNYDDADETKKMAIILQAIEEGKVKNMEELTQIIADPKTKEMFDHAGLQSKYKDLEVAAGMNQEMAQIALGIRYDEQKGALRFIKAGLGTAYEEKPRQYDPGAQKADLMRATKEYYIGLPKDDARKLGTQLQEPFNADKPMGLNEPQHDMLSEATAAGRAERPDDLGKARAQLSFQGQAQLQKAYEDAVKELGTTIDLSLVLKTGDATKQIEELRRQYAALGNSDLDARALALKARALLNARKTFAGSLGRIGRDDDKTT